MGNTQDRSRPAGQPVSHADPALLDLQHPAIAIPARVSARQVGFIIFLVMAAAFLGLAGDVVTHGWLTVHETALSAWIYLGRTARITAFLTGLTDLHSEIGGLCLAVLFAAYLAWRGHSRWLKTLLLVLPSGVLLNLAIKQWVHRPRPLLDGALASTSSFSFPSGHTTGAALLYGILAAYLLRRTANRALQAGLVAAAALLVCLVAFSRLYLGVHTLSDVMASLVLSVGWLGLCLGLGWFPPRDVAR